MTLEIILGSVRMLKKTQRLELVHSINDGQLLHLKLQKGALQ